MVFLWKLNPDAPPQLASAAGDEEESLLNKETWSCLGALVFVVAFACCRADMERRGGKDIYSLDWSPDSMGMVTGSIDTTVSVWNIAGAGGPRKVQEIRDHSHYVQGAFNSHVTANPYETPT